MKRILIYIPCLCMLLASACITEERVDGPAGETVSLSLSTRALDLSVGLRIIAVDALSGDVLWNEYPAQADPETDTYRITLRTGKVDFYLLGNEPPRLTPQLNELENSAELKTMEVRFGELPAVESPIGSTTRTNIPVCGTAKTIVRVTAEGKGEISPDGGSTWNNILDVKMHRLATKLSLFMIKPAANAADVVKIQKAEVLNIPHHSHIVGKAYTSQDFTSLTPYDSQTGMVLPQNSSAGIVLYEVILPEYIPADKTDVGQAMAIRVYGQYNGRNTSWLIPVNGQLFATDGYSLFRNNYYIMVVTVKTSGDMENPVEVNYRVAEWEDMVGDPSFFDESAISFASDWNYDSIEGIAENNVYVSGEGCAEYYFTLKAPFPVSWAATLTNPVDFMFDETGGAVSHGLATAEETCTIRIRPRKPTSQNNKKTAFFITVATAGGNVELDLPANTVGEGNRYTIIQIPN